MKDYVWVASYSHPHGVDSRVFRTEARAEAWKTEIAKDWFDAEFPDEEAPADDEIGKVYFDLMADRGGDEEYFNVEKCEIED